MALTLIKYAPLIPVINWTQQLLPSHKISMQLSFLFIRLYGKFGPTLIVF